MNKPKIHAHRGSRTRAPENTMPAFRQAVAEGADYIELDIRTTKDGKIVVCHDATLKRCGGVDITVSEHTYEEICKYPVHCPELFGDQFKDSAYVPLLEEVLLFILENPIDLNVEIKAQEDREYGYIERETLAMVERFGLKERVVYSTFDEYIIVKMLELDPECKIALLHDARIYNAGAHAKNLGCLGLHPSYKAGTQYRDLEKALELGLYCNVWTVNDLDHARDLAARGATGIITDTPAEVIEALA